MTALVYYGPGKRSWEDVPDPEVTDPEDAVVHVDAFTICGTDLHILRGDVPEVQPGRILGPGTGSAWPAAGGSSVISSTGYRQRPSESRSRTARSTVCRRRCRSSRR